MNCKQLEGLLIAYTNGELRGTLKQFIEEHLTDCAECQTALAGIRKTREKLLSLRNAPAMPEIKEEIMATIKIHPPDCGGWYVRLLLSSRRWSLPQPF